MTPDCLPSRCHPPAPRCPYAAAPQASRREAMARRQKVGILSIGVPDSARSHRVWSRRSVTSPAASADGRNLAQSELVPN